MNVLSTTRHWAEMIKLSHSLFALPYAVLATFLAARPGLPAAGQLGLIVLCMVGARSAAMTFNRLVDSDFDAENPRTRMRQLPAGVISRGAAWAFFVAAAAFFVLGCAGFWWWFQNPYPLLLALPVLLLLCAYSYTKRFTRWSHVLLGAAIALSPVAAWIAINPETLGAPAFALLGAVAFWIAGFDLIYACQDAEFDRARGLHSVPATWGVARALQMARGFHVLTVGFLLLVGVAAGLGPIYYAGVACVSALLIVENALVRPTDLSRVNLAFFTVNGVVGLLLGLLGVLDVLLR